MADGWWIRHRDTTNSQVSQNGCRNEEDIEALNKQMSYKQKRLQNAESAKGMISKVISKVIGKEIHK